MAFEKKLKKQDNEVDLLHQQLKRAKVRLKEASLKTEEQEATATIFKQKYTTALEKVHELQKHVELLEEELRYSHEKARGLLPLHLFAENALKYFFIRS